VTSPSTNELCLNLFQYSPFVMGDRPLRSLDELLGAAADAGWRHVGLDRYTLEALEIAPAALAPLLERHGLQCFEMLGLQVDDDPVMARREATSVARWVEAAGAQWVLTVSNGTIDDQLTETFAAVCDPIVAAGGRVALEFTPHYSVNSIAKARALCDAVGPSRARVLIDSWHVFRGSDSLQEVRACPVEAIGYVQFQDALPVITSLSEESLTRRTWPGEGEFDLWGFANAIRSTGYAAPVSCELLNSSWHEAGMAPEEFARRTRETSLPYWIDGAVGHGS
jgi:sugar phosphate isomerase/epimerase